MSGPVPAEWRSELLVNCTRGNLHEIVTYVACGICVLTTIILLSTSLIITIMKRDQQKKRRATPFYLQPKEVAKTKTIPTTSEIDRLNPKSSPFDSENNNENELKDPNEIDENRSIKGEISIAKTNEKSLIVKVPKGLPSHEVAAFVAKIVKEKTETANKEKMMNELSKSPESKTYDPENPDAPE